MAHVSHAKGGYLRQGTRPFRLANSALFASSLITYAAMYCTQPLLAIYAREFAVAPAVASLTVSLTTSSLAVCMLIAGSLSEAWGRKSVMVTSLFASASLAILAALAPGFSALLVIRALQGIALAGVPAVAMAYLSEEVAPSSLGFAMGLLIAGNAIGGMAGRTSVGVVAGFTSWRVPVAAVGVLGLGCAFLFARMLPPSRHFESRSPRMAELSRSLLGHLRDPGLLCLYGVGFLLMGGFVTLYNYIQFQLLGAPYRLSQSTVSWIFLLYVVGTIASTWVGQLADRVGRRRMLPVGIVIMLAGALLTLDAALWLKIVGVAAFTFGFFAGHSVASSWVGRRATHHRAQASALYLFAYYAGSSVGGTAGGVFWGAFGWGGVVAMIAACVLGAGLLAALLTRIPPLTAATGATAPTQARIEGNSR